MYVSLIYGGPQTKTKAKKRYLRSKKERRKLRKLSTGDSILPEGETSDNPEDAVPEGTCTAIDLTELGEQSTLVAEDGSGERKKRKLYRSIEEDSTENLQPPPVGAGEPSPVDEPGSSHPLPLFPLPTHPDAPSRIELALQGLDRAQIEAEFVDASSTLSIDLGTDNNQSALSLKTRKRLIDLGVNELFAGISHPFVRCLLLPLRLNSSDGHYSISASIRTQIYQPLRSIPSAAGCVRLGPDWKWEDACICAANNRGKTSGEVTSHYSDLIWSQLLSSRVVTRLRALIVLPTRDLVTQVREVFEIAGKGRGLRVPPAL